MINIERDTRLEIVRKNIRLAVALRNTNFAETARRAGLSRNALSHFVSTKKSLSYANMLAICDVLQIPIGIIDRPDAITESKIRLYTMLKTMPDHLAAEALERLTKAENDTEKNRGAE